MWKKIFAASSLTDSSDGNKVEGNVSRDNLPQHVAIIMDGNGRWAQKQGLLRTAGHTAGVKSLKRIVRTANDMGIVALTVYAFSTENWKRPPAEVNFLMKLFAEYLAKELREMHEENVRLNFIGRLSELNPALQKQMQDAVRLTENNTGLKFNIAANYGGRDELVRAFQKLAAEVQTGNLAPDTITEEDVDAALDTSELPPVDLLIRPGGDLRLSNFLLWQTAYAEFWFTETNWPDFTPELFRQAVTDFAKRQRRFGGLKNACGKYEQGE